MPRFVSDVLFKNDLAAGSYLNDLPVVRYLVREGHLPFHSNVTFFVGENGAGKSTLLEAVAVACGFNAEGGTRNFNFSTRDSHSELWKHLTVTKRDYPRDGFFLRAESVYNLATEIDALSVNRSYGGRSLHERSHGESFLAIVQERFGNDGLYILDEPEAALSPMRIQTLMCEMDSLVKRGSQFIIATHSPMLMAFPGAEVLEFSEEGIRPVDYRDTDHFRVTRDFLNAPERALKYLLEEEM